MSQDEENKIDLEESLENELSSENLENEDFETEFSEDGEEEVSSDTIKKLRKKLKESQAKVAENMDGWQRSRADYANLQKQSAEQTASLKNYIVGGVVEDLLPALDSFDMAMINKEVWESVDKNWRMGIEYILKQFSEALEKNGVTEIQVKSGDTFDPEQHQAMDSVETENEKEDGKVESVLQKGYKIDDTILRPAKVKTYKAK